MSSICRRFETDAVFVCCSSSSRNQATHQQWVGRNCRDKILLGTTLAVMGSPPHVVDPTWWTSCTVHERNPKSPLFWVWPLTFVHTTLITTETLKLGLSRQEETWHSPCLKRNKEMKHDHDSNPFIVWMFVLIVVERYPFVVVSKYGNCSYSIDFGWHKQVIHIFLPFLPHHWTLQILHL